MLPEQNKDYLNTSLKKTVSKATFHTSTHLLQQLRKISRMTNCRLRSCRVSFCRKILDIRTEAPSVQGEKLRTPNVLKSFRIESSKGNFSWTLLWLKSTVIRKRNPTKTEASLNTLQNVSLVWNLHCFPSLLMNLKALLDGQCLSIRNYPISSSSQLPVNLLLTHPLHRGR